MSKMAPLITAVALAPMLAGNAQAEKSNVVIQRFGNWQVHRRIDDITRRVDCVAIYRNEQSARLTYTSLFVAVAEPKKFQYRIDDRPTSSVHSVDREPQTMGIRFQGPILDWVLRSKRLRIKVLTYTSQVVRFDFDLAGITAAYKLVTPSRCETGAATNPGH
jgi:hypothetical protein